MGINWGLLEGAMGDTEEGDAEKFVEFLEANGYEISTDYGKVSVVLEGAEEPVDDNGFQALLAECFS